MREILLKSYRHIIDDFDNDDEIEEVIAYLQSVKYIKNGKVVWQHICSGVPLVVRAFDINGDGLKEIIVGGSERKVLVFSVTGELIKEVNYWNVGDKRAGWIWDIAIEDINGDKKPEILIGGMAAWGGNGIDVKLYNSDFEELWIHHVDRSAFRVGIYKLNKSDKKFAIITTMGGVVEILNWNGDILHKHKLNAGISALEVADINNDGKKEIILGTVDGDLVIFDDNLNRLWGTKISTYYPVQVYNIVARDFNSDSKVEILASGRRCVNVFTATGELVHRSDDNILIGDIDGDTIKEEIKLQLEKISVYKKGKKLWERHFPDRIESVTLCDVDKDGASELVVGFTEGTVVVIDKDNNISNSWSIGESISVIQSGDYNNDGNIEIITGSHFGTIKTFDTTGSQLDSFNLSGEIGSISIFDIDQDGKNELIVSTKNQAGEIKLFKNKKEV